MDALVWEAPRQMMMRSLDEPQTGPDEVCIEVNYAGICGSELGGYLGHNSLRVPPLVMGHEFAGVIAEVGAAVTESALQVGAAVTANPLIYCGECAACQQGLNQLCSQRRLIGAHRPGAFARYVTIPAQQVSVLPEGMSARDGAMVEPAACGLRIGELAGDVAGETCLVIGAGPIGLLALQALQMKGAAAVYIAELDPARLAMGAELGGTAIDPRESDSVEVLREVTDGRGAAVAVDAVGAAVTRQQCVHAVRATGRVVLSGLHEESSAINFADAIRREVTLRGAFAYSPADFAAALDALAAGRLRLDPWVIEAPLAEGGQWFDRLVDAPGDVAKVLLRP